MNKEYIADVSSVYGVSEHDKKYLNTVSYTHLTLPTNREV